MLTLQDLQCARGNTILFHQLNVTVKPGSILLIEGANGSGKTTLLKSIAQLCHYQGRIQWRGQCVKQHRESFYNDLLYIGHHASIKDNLTALENLQYLSQLGNSNADACLDSALQKMGLAHVKALAVKQLSAGQRRRVALARLFLSRATLWLLDEPFAALDKATMALMETIIRQHCQQHGIVVLSSHQAINVANIPLIRVKLCKNLTQP